MNIDDMLELMDETLEDAFTMPLIGKRMVDAEKLQGIIDDIRLKMPSEIRQARNIVQDRAEIVETARREAEEIIKKAEKRAEAMTSEQEIVKRSQQKAAEILQSAQQHSKEIRQSAKNYCERVLSQTEEQLMKSCSEIKTVRNSIRNRDKMAGAASGPEAK